jgi:hypothetical protein
MRPAASSARRLASSARSLLATPGGGKMAAADAGAFHDPVVGGVDPWAAISAALLTGSPGR